MNYFKILGLTFGLIALMKPFYMHLIPWDEYRFIAKTYTPKPPRWVFAVGLSGLSLILFTWYKHFTLGVPYSIVITLLFSFTAIKAIYLIFDYKKFQEWVEGLLNKDKGRKIILVDIAAGLFGLIVLVSTLFLY